MKREHEMGKKPDDVTCVMHEKCSQKVVFIPVSPGKNRLLGVFEWIKDVVEVNENTRLNSRQYVKHEEVQVATCL